VKPSLNREELLDFPVSGNCGNGLRHKAKGARKRNNTDLDTLNMALKNRNHDPSSSAKKGNCK
jgi:hypothetical protein